MKGKIFVYTDGASRGNPGKAGIGAVVLGEKGQTLRKIKEYIGETTNNVAEYRALIKGLETARTFKPEGVEVFVDSQLIFCQVRGAYKVKCQGLLPYYRRALQLVAMTPNCELRLVGREENKEADKLATMAVKEAIRKEKQSAESCLNGSLSGEEPTDLLAGGGEGDL